MPSGGTTSMGPSTPASLDEISSSSSIGGLSEVTTSGGGEHTENGEKNASNTSTCNSLEQQQFGSFAMALQKPFDELSINWLNLLKRKYTILREALFKYDYEQRRHLNLTAAAAAAAAAVTASASSSMSLSDITEASNNSNSFDFKKQLVKSITCRFIKNLTNVTPKTFCNESFAKKSNQSCLILISLLKDKMHHLFVEQREPYEAMVERARFLRANQVNVFDGHNASKESVLNTAKSLLVKHTRDYITLIQNIPGLIDFLDLNDVVTLAEDNLCLVFGFKVSHLFIDGEFYAMVDGVQLSRKWMDVIVGVDMANKIFDFHMSLNALGLTDVEMALLIPILLTSPCE